MPHRLKQSALRIVGTKQTLKALLAGEVKLVYLARDADDRVTRPIRDLAERRGIELVEVDSMATLGRACEIDVGAAAAALRKS